MPTPEPVDLTRILERAKTERNSIEGEAEVLRSNVNNLQGQIDQAMSQIEEKEGYVAELTYAISLIETQLNPPTPNPDPVPDPDPNPGV